MTIWLVRHPKPLIDSGVCYGASDVPCDAQVIEQAAQELLAQLPRGLPIVSSPLQRCEHLAQVLCRLEPDFAYKTDYRMAEMNFGAWELQAWDNIPVMQLQAWTDDFANYRCGGSGESTAQFVRRVMHRLTQSFDSKQDEIWITHAGVMRAMVWTQQQSTRMAKEQSALMTRRPQAQALWQLCPTDLVDGLRAGDWPTDALAYCQVMKVQQSDWLVWQQ
ncbi:MAG: phosphoglycerate kinase [Brachymonas sp.]|nr:phosphoglycerate kinase [Brachymonas sp.]